MTSSQFSRTAARYFSSRHHLDRPLDAASNRPAPIQHALTIKLARLLPAAVNEGGSK